MKKIALTRLVTGWLLTTCVFSALASAQEPIQLRQRSPVDDSGVDLRRTPVVDVVEHARPAVVSIETNVPQRGRDWFGQVVLRDQGVSGTGVVIYEDGYIVTNNHVVGSSAGQGDAKILVRFDEADDSKVYEATLISREPKEDLALIKIEGGPFPTVPMSDQEPLLGETVIAIGNALRHTHTVSQGIISGLHREVDVSDGNLHFQGLLQTDASINPGNSGGPLLNIYGELIGINTVISAGAENIGFAIPVARVKYVLSNHLLDLRKARAYLGAQFDVEQQVVEAVVPAGPADLAGFRVGDRVLAIDGKAVLTSEGFSLARLSIPPAEEARFTVRRDGQEIDLEVASWNPVDGVVFEGLGIVVRPVQFGKNFRNHLQIESLDPDGPAGRIGIQAGDVLAAVRPTGFRSYQLGQAGDLALLVTRLQPGTTLDIEVWRDDDGDGILERNERYSELYSGTVELR